MALNKWLTESLSAHTLPFSTRLSKNTVTETPDTKLHNSSLSRLYASTVVFHTSKKPAKAHNNKIEARFMQMSRASRASGMWDCNFVAFKYPRDVIASETAQEELNSDSIIREVSAPSSPVIPLQPNEFQSIPRAISLVISAGSLWCGIAPRWGVLEANYHGGDVLRAIVPWRSPLLTTPGPLLARELRR